MRTAYSSGKTATLIDIIFHRTLVVSLYYSDSAVTILPTKPSVAVCYHSAGDQTTLILFNLHHFVHNQCFAAHWWTTTRFSGSLTEVLANLSLLFSSQGLF